MELFPESSLGALREAFKTPQKVLIITHFNPDGDALGSSLGLKLYLEKLGHSVKSLLPSEAPPYYDWMPEIKDCIIFQEKLKTSYEDDFKTFDFIFCLDFNSTSRVNGYSKMLAESSIPKILIDHHEEPTNEFQYVFSYPGRSSTCELIYDFILKFSNKNDIDGNIATCLYTGLITDTGGFQFSSTHASTHQMAAHLIEIGINPSEIYNHCFNNFSLNRLKLFGHCIASNMKIYEHKKLAILWIDRKTKELFDIQDGDTEGLVNYPLKVMDIEASILFKEDYDKIRISFRSKKDIDVNQIARKYFDGGGHKNAAGGMSKKKLKETILYFESILEEAF